MKVLVIGSGGREHALAYKLAASPNVSEVLVAPGNAGTAREAGCRNVPVAADDIAGLLRLAADEGVGFTVVGPELPLSLGVVDAFEAAGRRIFGPTKAAAQLEASKAFTKGFLERHRIPTAQYRVFTEADAACAYVRERGAPIVIKADGLAAGKGVVVAMTLAEAETAIRDMLSGEMLGKAGARVVIEDFLEGEEASFIVVAGKNGEYAVMASAQDHKRVGDGDTGPNTGGMGAYSPAPVVTPEVHARACREVIEPTLAGMAAEGTPFSGFLYAGLMIDKSGAPYVIEFNVRMGDPETQPILMRLDSDLLELLEASIDNRLSQHPPVWATDATLGVVMAAEGYPGPIAKGDAIQGLDADFGAQAKVFHAGTSDKDGAVVSTGGRVLCVVGRGADIRAAQAAAYAAVAKISWRGEFHRGDIGWRALAREA
ncbi:phosphoribosylamine--glycine ligase [Stagnimonas aquatica]|uniref:Phosphoribosylamine--glycine ligase n=1 Tax=Stagnimonas aquatica TaxID=2689987 RepID=A0A3N0VKF7_9GAMM|nr:phosphoribosylamine--glycine ligase [Stagnimonas aquatica]ROH93191.1 phosphoribosylamine--glycine ligase [Stagnimonas aquatica]